MEIHYTAHFNWKWIVESSVERLQHQLSHEYSQANEAITIINSRFRDLLSIKMESEGGLKKLKPQFALFRLEVLFRDRLSYIWADSQAFSFLDAKDSLYKYLLEAGKAHLMPETIMIPWDTFELSQLLELLSNHQLDATSVHEHQLPFRKALLKAALGAGGFGLYFVDTVDDIIAVVKAHARRAAKYEGFLEELASSHAGSIPSWSLQRYIYAIESKAYGCKTQVRAYVVKKGSKLYAYRQYEVRMPCWTAAEDSHDSKWKDAVEEELIGDGKAVPYNDHRNKEETNRMMIEEVEELVHAATSISQVVREAMIGLYPRIIGMDKQSVLLNADHHLAIAAIDLVVERSPRADDDASYNQGYRAYILELNSNPAIAGENKRMSDMYREHLQRFVNSLMIFGLALDHSDHLGDEMFDLII